MRAWAVQVNLFDGLQPEQIAKLAAELKPVSFKELEWVFKQGDEGDDFYVIVAGEAEVLRTENAGTPEKVTEKLATLKQWQSFGERSLLKGQTRYAGIRATSRTLKLMHIDRAAFEKVLGPLKALLPDLHD